MITSKTLKSVLTKVKAGKYVDMHHKLLISNGELTVTNFENTVIIKDSEISKETSFLIDRADYMNCLETFPNGNLSIHGNELLISNEGGSANFDINLDLTDFTIVREKWETDGPEKLGDLNKLGLNQLIQASKFISKDELRPSMCNVYAFDKICGTDAHRMFFENSESPLTKQILISKNTISLLGIFGPDYQVYLNRSILIFKNDKVEIIQKVINERYPQFEAIISKDNYIKVEFNTVDFITHIENAAKFANKQTNQITLDVKEGSIIISSEDQDTGSKYSYAIKAESNDCIKIGFNAIFILDMLKGTKGKTKLSLESPNRAVIFNGNMLLMPVMLSSYS